MARNNRSPLLSLLLSPRSDREEAGTRAESVAAKPDRLRVVYEYYDPIKNAFGESLATPHNVVNAQDLDGFIKELAESIHPRRLLCVSIQVVPVRK